MQIKSILFAPLVAAGLASAATTNPVTFEVVAIAPGSGFHLFPLQAASSRFLFGSKDIKATCAAKSDNTATFRLTNGELQLYKASGTPQRAWTDRGMGRGIFTYVNGDGIARQGERTTWSIDQDSNLSFKGSGLLACYYDKDKTWSVFVADRAPDPSMKCTKFVARAIKTDRPNSCTYTGGAW